MSYFNNRLTTCVQPVVATVNFYSSEAVRFQMGTRGRCNSMGVRGLTSNSLRQLFVLLWRPESISCPLKQDGISKIIYFPRRRPSALGDMVKWHFHIRKDAVLQYTIQGGEKKDLSWIIGSWAWAIQKQKKIKRFISDNLWFSMSIIIHDIRGISIPLTSGEIILWEPPTVSLLLAKQVFFSSHLDSVHTLTCFQRSHHCFLSSNF